MEKQNEILFDETLKCSNCGCTTFEHWQTAHNAPFDTVTYTCTECLSDVEITVEVGYTEEEHADAFPEQYNEDRTAKKLTAKISTKF